MVHGVVYFSRRKIQLGKKLQQFLLDITLPEVFKSGIWHIIVCTFTAMGVSLSRVHSKLLFEELQSSLNAAQQQLNWR